MNNTSVVVCSYHRTFTGDGNTNIIKFKNQNFLNFHVLFDNQLGFSKEEISNKYDGANISLYSDVDFEINKFNKPIDINHFWGKHQNPKYFYAHYRMLVHYIKNPLYDYYWFFDDDVTFEGDLKKFLENCQEFPSDFMAIQAFKKENYKDFPAISIINDRMSGSKGYWLGHCPGPGDNFKNTDIHIGSFFPIVRFSKAGMKYLLDLHDQGYYGYSEGFVPTSLASDGFKVNSIMNEYNQYIVDSSVCDLKHKGQNFTWEWL